MATTGCSACLVEAIQQNDENWFRRLLADLQLSFNDTFSIPKWYKTVEDSLSIKWSSQHLLIPRGGGSSSNQLCSHVIVRENLDACTLQGTTISLVQMAMLFSTPEFNSLQLLINSGRFDLSEPIIFHEFYAITDTEFDWTTLRVEDSIVFALEVDIFRYSGRFATDFLNIKTLFAAGVWSPKAVLHLVSVNQYEWCGLSALGVVQLFYARRPKSDRAESILALLKTLCNMGIELGSNELLVYYMRMHYTVMIVNGTILTGRRVPPPPLKSHTIHSTLIDALFDICRLHELDWANCENYFRIFLRHGLLFLQRDAALSTTLFIIYSLHSDVESAHSVVLRIARQLLAIGLFRTPNTRSNPELEWPRRCLYKFYHTDMIDCPICSEGHTLRKFPFVCRLLAPLIDEFFNGPLTLQQLSRIELRTPRRNSAVRASCAAAATAANGTTLRVARRRNAVPPGHFGRFFHLRCH